MEDRKDLGTLSFDLFEMWSHFTILSRDYRRKGSGSKNHAMRSVFSMFFCKRNRGLLWSHEEHPGKLQIWDGPPMRGEVETGRMSRTVFFLDDFSSKGGGCWLSWILKAGRSPYLAMSLVSGQMNQSKSGEMFETRWFSYTESQDKGDIKQTHWFCFRLSFIFGLT